MAAKKEKEAVVPAQNNKALVERQTADVAALREALRESYPILSENHEEITLAIKENVGGGSIGVNDLDRVRVPAGGGLEWEIPSLEGTKRGKELTGILVAWKDVRAYWPEKFSGARTPPSCTSDDGVIGVGTPGGACATCKFAEFASADDGKGRGQACKSMRMLFLVQPGAMLPTVVAAPPTSLAGMRKYFLRLASEGVPYYNAETSMRLEPAKNQGGIGYSQIVATMTRRIPADQTQGVKKYAEALGPALRRAAAATMQAASDDEGGAEAF